MPRTVLNECTLGQIYIIGAMCHCAIIRLEEFAMICSLGARKRCNMLRSSGTGEFNSSLVILLTSGARSTQTGLC